ncbi:hypothetical protein CXG81DRAFT_23893 [Caulochytrium protostelioides]|uniref:Uncharacterized protein n=1 Tax=Caulochytrium protostelioides TaxID=1555241 RepID=A0A4P9XDB9_9FUNG|nr:hypothetical protein CXG81DRAFT_23893 [Caulochytrium protostelioides]|eukprot:RKP03497.1 hypothetical protein CXG81DRAFT_23893 [Caulochytrium protostelioides]
MLRAPAPRKALDFGKIVDPTCLKVYVLPARNHKYAFAAKFLPARAPWEHHATVLSYVARKWRYDLSDLCGTVWHRFGANAMAQGPQSWAARAYMYGNRMTSRSAEAEYFLKQIPHRTQQIEIIYPSTLRGEQIDAQLQGWLATAEARQTPQIWLWTMLLPLDVLLAKVVSASFANAFLFYNVFRVNAHVRARNGSRVLQKLQEADAVTWTASTDLEAYLDRVGRDVTAQLRDEHARDGEPPDAAWTYAPGDDLHDAVVARLGHDIKLPELKRHYHRTRMTELVWPTPAQSPAPPSRYWMRHARGLAGRAAPASPASAAATADPAPPSASG